MRRLLPILLAALLFADMHAQGPLSGIMRFGATVVDSTDPTTVITAPDSDGAANISTASSTTLGGTAADNVGVLRVDYSCNHGQSGTASGTTTWTVSLTGIPVGDTICTATAFDTSSNDDATPASITITRDSGGAEDINLLDADNFDACAAVDFDSGGGTNEAFCGDTIAGGGWYSWDQYDNGGGFSNLNANSGACYGGAGKCFKIASGDNNPGFGGSPAHNWYKQGHTAVTTLYVAMRVFLPATMKWRQPDGQCSGAVPASCVAAASPSFVKMLYINDASATLPIMLLGCAGQCGPAMQSTNNSPPATGYVGTAYSNWPLGQWVTFAGYFTIATTGIRRGWIELDPKGAAGTMTRVLDGTWNTTRTTNRFEFTAFMQNMNSADFDGVPSSDSGSGAFYLDDICLAESMPSTMDTGTSTAPFTGCGL